MLGRKKIMALIIGICIVGGIVVISFKPKPENMVIKETEHTVINDDITVGIDGGGVVKLVELKQNFKINGVVEEIYVKKGEKIKKGDKIAKISEKEINEQIEELKVEKDAKETMINTTGNSDMGGDLGTLKKEVDNITKKIKNLKSNLNKLYLYADNDGIILDLGYEVGAEISTSKAGAIIGNDKEVYLDVLLAQTDIIDVKEEQKIKATLETYPDIEVDGVVKEKSYVSSEQGEEVNYKVRISIDSKDLEIYPGMTAEVKFIIKNKENVVQVPNRVIKNIDSKQFVKVKENGEIKEVEVKTGFSDGNVTEVLEGLQENQIVIEER